MKMNDDKSSDHEDNAQKRKFDIPVAVVKPRRKKKQSADRKTKTCLLCKKHNPNESVKLENHSRFCKSMEEILDGNHWCHICCDVFKRRINMAKTTQKKRNDKKDERKTLHKEEVLPESDEESFICQIYFKKINKIPTQKADVKEDLSSNVHKLEFYDTSSVEMVNVSSDINEVKTEVVSTWTGVIPYKSIAKLLLECICANEVNCMCANEQDYTNDGTMNSIACPMEIDTSTQSSLPPLSSTSSSASVSKTEDNEKSNFPKEMAKSDTHLNLKTEKNYNATYEEILIRSWEMISHPDIRSVLSGIPIYSWLYLIIKQNDGDVNSAINMIINGSKESGQFYYHLNNITYNKLVKDVSSTVQSNIHVPIARPAINPYLLKKVMYKERVLSKTFQPYVKTNPYYVGPSTSQGNSINVPKKHE